MNNGIMRSAVMLRVSESVIDSVRIAVPEPMEWQGIRNEIDAAMICT
jgi:hypothetical protein